MSRFYGSVRGSAASEAARQGSAGSGIEGHIRGWEMGIEVRMGVDPTGADVAQVFITRGSNSDMRGCTLVPSQNVLAFIVRDDAEDGIVVDHVGPALVAVVLEEFEDKEENQQ